MRRWWCRAGAAPVVAALLGLAAAAPAAAALTGGTTTVDRTLRDSRIGESSGLVLSRRTGGVLWTHNDSGNGPVLYALGRNGSTVATARLGGVADVDWEAIAPLTGRDGALLLAVGDIGDNTASRSRIEIDVVPEPAGTGSSRVSPVRVLRLRYPDGAQDAETLLADPRDGRLYVVTKGMFTSTIYAVPSSAWPGTAATPRTVTATLQPVARIGVTLATDGAVLPDGRFLVRTYGRLDLFPPLTPPAPGTTPGSDVPTLSALGGVTLPPQQQGEGLAVADADTGEVLLSSEGVGSQVLRLTVPPATWSAGAAAAAAAASSSARATPPVGAAASGDRASSGPSSATGRGTPTGDPAAGAGGGGGRAWLITLAGGGVFVVLLLIAGLLGRLRRPW